MKSAYELAMERLEKSEPQAKLNGEQKAAIAAIDEKYTARIAERDVFLSGLITQAAAAGNHEEIAELETQRSREAARLKADCEAEKEKIRAAAGT